MTSNDWPTPEEVQQALSQRGESVLKETVEAVMDVTWGLVLKNRASLQPAPQPEPDSEGA